MQITSETFFGYFDLSGQILPTDRIALATELKRTQLDGYDRQAAIGGVAVYDATYKKTLAVIGHMGVLGESDHVRLMTAVIDMQTGNGGIQPAYIDSMSTEMTQLLVDQVVEVV